MLITIAFAHNAIVQKTAMACQAFSPIKPNYIFVLMNNYYRGEAENFLSQSLIITCDKTAWFHSVWYYLTN